MILLLNGATDIARALLIEQFLKAHPAWRHIAVEELTGLPFLQAVSEGEQQRLSMNIACHCANEVAEEGVSVILSHGAAAGLLDLLKAEIEGPLLTIHLGSKEEATGFDHAIPTLNRSASDVTLHLERIVGNASA